MLITKIIEIPREFLQLNAVPTLPPPLPPIPTKNFRKPEVF